MAYSTEDIVGMVERRRRDRGPIIEAMRRIKDAYNGELVLPMPEVDREEDPAVPNIILDGIDGLSSRIASVYPRVDVVPESPTSVRARKRAEIRRLAHLAWWEQNMLNLALVRRARWLVGYGAAPVVVKPDFGKGIPRFLVRDPLSAFPEPTMDEYDPLPGSCAFVVAKPYKWLLTNYPLQARALTGGRGPYEIDPGERFEVIEWYDEAERVLIALSNRPPPTTWPASSWSGSGPMFLELDRMMTDMDGRCPVVYPGRITLDRPRGQFDAAIGIYKAHARMMALGMIAVERDIFPDRFLVQRPGEQARFIQGPFDGRTGEVNVVEGTPIDLHATPGQMHVQYMSMLERAGRITGGTPAEFGGESPTNIRTGRRGEQVLNAAVSFDVGEGQNLLALSLEKENELAIIVARNFFGYQRKKLKVAAVRKSVEYVPSQDFESVENSVTYPIVGTDVNNLTIRVAQLNGTGFMSKATGRRMHPDIADPEYEHDMVVSEGLEMALLSGLQQQAATGAIPVTDIAEIMQMVESDRVELADAIAKQQKKAQERQATSGPPGTPTGPVPPGSPEAQPGLAQPGVGAEAGTAGPPPNLEEFLAGLGVG